MHMPKEGSQPIHIDASRHPLYRAPSALNIECYQSVASGNSVQLQEEDRLKLAILNEIRFQNEITLKTFWKLVRAKDGSILAHIVIKGVFNLSHARRIVESLYQVTRTKDQRKTPAIYALVKNKTPNDPNNYCILFPYFDFYTIDDLRQAVQLFSQSWFHQSAIDERHMIKQIVKLPNKPLPLGEANPHSVACLLPFLADLIRSDTNAVQLHEQTQSVNSELQNSHEAVQNNSKTLVHVGPNPSDLVKLYTAKKGDSNPEVLLKEFLGYFQKNSIRYLQYDQVRHNPFLVGSPIVETWEELVASAPTNRKYDDCSTSYYIIFVNLSEAELMLISKVTDFMFDHADFFRLKNIRATNIDRNGHFLGITCTVATAHLDHEKVKSLNFTTKQLDENTSCVFLPLLDLNTFDARALNIMPANLPVEQYNITYQQRANSFAAKIDQTLAEQTKRIAVILNLLIIKPQSEVKVPLNTPLQFGFS